MRKLGRLVQRPRLRLHLGPHPLDVVALALYRSQPVLLLPCRGRHNVGVDPSCQVLCKVGQDQPARR